MNAQNLLNEILAILHGVKDDPQKLEIILDFLNENICEETEEEIYEIPAKFEKLLTPIAQSIDYGMISFLNPETLETEELPKMLMEDPYEYKMITGFGIEDEDLKHKSWKKYYEFTPLDPHDSFKIMEVFAENIDNAKFQEQLFLALNNRKPFANFKWKIDNSEYRQDWFDFKQRWLERHVRQEIYFHLENQKQ